MTGGVRRSLVIAPFINPDAPSCRPSLAVRALARLGPVDVLTTGFDHFRKHHKDGQGVAGADRVACISVPGYRANAGPARFLSHLVFALGAARWYRARRESYDLVYATSPLSFAAWLAFRVSAPACRVLDVIDIWPDTLPFPDVSRRALAPLFALWRATFAAAVRRADRLLTVNDRFLHDAHVYFHGDAQATMRLYLAHARLPVEKGRRESRPTLVYVGNIGHVYDFETLLDALSRPALRERWQLFIVGEGDRRAWLLNELQRRGIAHEYFGQVFENAPLARILERAHAGFNGFHASSASFSYKAATYLAAGLPIINSMGGDLNERVRLQGLGCNYRAGDAVDLARCLRDFDVTDTDVNERCRKFFETELNEDVVLERLHAFLSTGIRPDEARGAWA